MKSPQIEFANYIDKDEKELYSDLQVLRSNAGFYIGTIYNNPEGYQEPGSRDSGYYPTREEAQKALDSGNWEQRMTP